MKAIQGPDPSKAILSGVVHLLAPELVPGEKHSCTIFLATESSDTPTVDAWVNKYGEGIASSEKRKHLAVFVYRIHFDKPKRVAKGPMTSSRSFSVESRRDEAPVTRRSTPDITWNFDNFLGTIGSEGKEPKVLSFQAHGRNNLDEPILHVGGFLRSDVTNIQFPIQFVVNGEAVPPDNTNGIPRKTEFDVTTGPLRNDPIPASKFLLDFAGLTFVFKYDGKIFQRHFTQDDIWKLMRPLPILRAPGVIKRLP
jgi:hypothetical protein